MDFQLAFQASILFTQVVLLLALIAFLGAELARITSSYLDVPFLGTKFEMLPAIEQALRIRSGDVVYDLGCGDGRLLFFCARVHPEARFVGVERNPLIYAYSCLLFFLHGSPKNVTLTRGDIFKTDFSDATRMFVFLLGPVMNELFAREPELTQDMHMVSRAFRIAGKEPLETIRISQKDGWFGEHLAYVYQFKATAR